MEYVLPRQAEDLIITRRNCIEISNVNKRPNNNQMKWKVYSQWKLASLKIRRYCKSTWTENQKTSTTIRQNIKGKIQTTF